MATAHQLSRQRRRYNFRPLDSMPFGRKKPAAIHDLRAPNQPIQMDFNISTLFVGKTAVISPHFDDASLNYGGAIYKFTSTGGVMHTVNVSPGHRTPIKGIRKSDVEARIKVRVTEGEKESRILGTEFHFLNLRQLYEQRRILSAEAKRFYQKMDEINPITLVIPGPFDTHPDHQNCRILALNWAADQARNGNPKVIVEAPSMWGSIPETLLTHMVELDNASYQARKKAQRAHNSQRKRTNFPAVADYKVRTHAIIGGEHKHGLVSKTPVLNPTEIYSQHVLIQDGNRTVFRRLDERTMNALFKL